MTTTAATTTGDLSPTAPARTREVPRGPVWMWRDTWTEANRHLIATWRNPDLLVFATIQPIMFVVLFVYVFGRHRRALHDKIAGTAVVYSWDARGARWRFLARQQELDPHG
mgnify:CR=1 FL=1